MLNITLLILAFIALVQCVEIDKVHKRDGSCMGNFWLKLCITSVNGNRVDGKEYVTSGKSASNADDKLVLGTIKNAMNTQDCYLDRDNNNFFCNVNPAWNSADWSTWVNTEILCVPYDKVVYDEVVWKNRRYNGC